MEQREEQSSKLRLNRAKRAHPVFYDSFFHAQEKALGRASVLFPDHPKDDPYSYKINIVRHPYEEPCIGPVVPPPPPPRRRKTVSGSSRSASIVVAARDSRQGRLRSMRRWDHNDDNSLVASPGHIPFSEIRAPNVYGKKPFGYDFLKHPLWKFGSNKP
jgi:hypothetical protein